MYKIMIIEDDITIGKSIYKHLEKWDLMPTLVDEFKDIIEQFVKLEPHLILMDISLPFYSGYHWCNEIRKISKVPIIFISSASENMNIVMAMNMGGDDFIAKPFDLSVVVAKIQALLRRSYAYQGQGKLIEHKGIILNLNEATLTFNGHKLDLTKNDFRILQLLFEKCCSVVSREEIMVRLWESDNFIDDNTLTVNITRLRKKLSEIGIEDLISTKKGIGYVIL